ncbi:MAG: alpha/beta hydrolase [Bacteroidetes bacterium]|nr:MAG: alpha/beta hydrolase [Bacteroidota bacterium]
MKRIVLVLLLITAILGVTYIVGPKPDPLLLNPDIEDAISADIGEVSDVASWIIQKDESKSIRTGNESQVYWADSINKPTEFVLLYLHGFSACPEEGAPIHKEFAIRYGMNMYAPLLAEHGLIETENMINFTAEAWINSAKEALAVAQIMGEKVIVMGTSTGCTSSLFLASGKNNIHSLICYSPNIEVFDPKASLLAGPWGLEIARVVKGGNYHEWEAPVEAQKYWHTKYRLESVVELQRLIEGTMIDKTFNKIEIPTLVLCNYKDEVQQDSVVSVPAMREMFTALGSNQKKFVELPDVDKHALASKYFSKDLLNVSKETNLFAEEVLMLRILKR